MRRSSPVSCARVRRSPPLRCASSPMAFSDDSCGECGITVVAAHMHGDGAWQMATELSTAGRLSIAGHGKVWDGDGALACAWWRRAPLRERHWRAQRTLG
eukprot:2973419-Prymnesium_polylepis.2